MTKIRTVDFSNWSPYEGFAEGSGRSEKLWLQSDKGEIGLFKYPKYDANTSEVTTEHISEHLAHQIGLLIGVATASVDIGFYNGRIGSMSYLINKPDEAVVEGVNFITGKHPDYDPDSMQERYSGRYYCIDHLLEISDSLMVIQKWIQMMLFDYLIGNSDRHQNNWAILVRYMERNTNTFIGRVCPLYDNGSSLCCYVNDSMIPGFLGNDRERFIALADTKSRSMIRIDGFNKKLPKHSEVVEVLLRRYPYAKEFGIGIVLRMTMETIADILNAYSDLLSTEKKLLINKYLNYKVELLKQMIMKVTP